MYVQADGLSSFLLYIVVVCHLRLSLCYCIDSDTTFPSEQDFLFNNFLFISGNWEFKKNSFPGIPEISRAISSLMHAICLAYFCILTCFILVLVYLQLMLLHGGW